MLKKIKTKQLIALLISILAIFICLEIGRLIQSYIGGLPASLYGLLCYAGLLQFGFIQKNITEAWISQSMPYVPLVFVPVCVGVIQYASIFKKDGFKIIFIGISVTLIGLLFTSLCSRKFLKSENLKDTVFNSLQDQP